MDDGSQSAVETPAGVHREHGEGGSSLFCLLLRGINHKINTQNAIINVSVDKRTVKREQCTTTVCRSCLTEASRLLTKKYRALTNAVLPRSSKTNARCWTRGKEVSPNRAATSGLWTVKSSALQLSAEASSLASQGLGSCFAVQSPGAPSTGALGTGGPEVRDDGPRRPRVGVGRAAPHSTGVTAAAAAAVGPAPEAEAPALRSTQRLVAPLPRTSPTCAGSPLQPPLWTMVGCACDRRLHRTMAPARALSFARARPSCPAHRGRDGYSGQGLQEGRYSPGAVPASLSRSVGQMAASPPSPPFRLPLPTRAWTVRPVQPDTP